MINESLLTLRANLLSKQYKRSIKPTDPLVYKHSGEEAPYEAKFEVKAVKNVSKNEPFQKKLA